MLVLILDSKLAVQGAVDGIKLCLWTVLPALFPFFVVTPLFCNNIDSKNTWMLRPLGKLCSIPPGSEGILLVGYLGGYPIGAKSIMEAYSSGNLSKDAALRMLSFCNNAGPAFIFGMVTPLFDSVAAGWCLWLITILSSVFVALSLQNVHTTNKRTAHHPVYTTFPQLITNAIKVAANVCAWVIIFRIILTILEYRVFCGNWPIPQVIVFGLLELSNGIIEVATIADPYFRFVFCAVFLSAGGLCVTLQTYSIVRKLHMRTYIIGKALQTIYSLLLSIALAPILFSNGNVTIAVISAIICTALLVYFKFIKKV